MFRIKLVFIYCLSFISIHHYAGNDSEDRKGVVDSLMNLAYSLEIENPDSAINLYKQIELMVNPGKDWLTLGRTHNYRAIVYFEKGMYDKALEHNEQALVIFEAHAYKAGIAAIFNNIGNIKLLSGSYNDAVKSYYEGMKILEEEKDTQRVAFSYMNIGVLFLQNKYYKEALDYTEKSMNWAKMLGDDSFIAELYINLANIYQAQKHNIVYRQYIDSALNYAGTTDYNYAKMLALNSLSAYFNNSRMYDSALHYSILARNSAKIYKNPYNLAEVYVLLGKNFLLAGYPDSALLYLYEAQQLAAENDYFPLHTELKLNLANAYRQQNDFQNAFETLSEFVVMNDSLYSFEIQKQLQEADRKYKVALKESQIEKQKASLQAKEREIQRKNLTITFSIIILILSLAFIFILIQYFKNKHKLTQQAMEKVSLQREKDIMKALMAGEEKERQRIARELHDGVNGNLAALKLQMSDVKNGAFYQLLDKTMDEIRYLSHNLIPDTVKKFGVLQAVKQYFAHVNETSGPQVDIELAGTDGKLNDEVAVHIYRIIQELFNNAIKHAEAKNIFVQLIINNNEAMVTVEDDGVGFEADNYQSLNPGYGIGLSGIENRIKYLQGQFDINSSTQSGTSINVVIPLKQPEAV